MLSAVYSCFMKKKVNVIYIIQLTYSLYFMAHVCCVQRKKQFKKKPAYVESSCVFNIDLKSWALSLR